MCSQDYLKLLLALPLNYCVVSCAFVSLSIKCVYGNVASFFFLLVFLLSLRFQPWDKQKIERRRVP